MLPLPVTPRLWLSILFSGGLKDGLRHLRNSWKLSFQSAFSSDSSMRASTQSPLKQNTGEMGHPAPSFTTEERKSAPGPHTPGAPRGGQASYCYEKVFLYTDFPQPPTILTSVSIQSSVIPDVRSLKCSSQDNHNFLNGSVQFWLTNVLLPAHLLPVIAFS